MNKSLDRIRKELDEFREKRNIVSEIVSNSITEEEDSVGREWWISHECFNNLENWDRDVVLDTYLPNVKLIPSSIGTTIYVECPFCKKRKNVTDFSNW
ncbi:MAG: hypothetical protein HOO21_05110 [Candidatus Marinimicrobia bacterium]|nr:hypothetical protein [Candidatus Neomarinimicrobiota bacterium]